jgi:type II secretory pathway pseudopilin PulG
MNKRMGLTLVEVIVAIGLLGLIALVGLQMMAFSYRYLLESRKYTHDTFTVQQNVEQMMQVARSTQVDAVDPSTLQSVTLFGKEVVAHKIDTEIRQLPVLPMARFTLWFPTMALPTPSRL